MRLFRASMAAALALGLVPSGAALAAGACVADPMAVAVRIAPRASAADNLPPTLVAKLDAAARAAFAEAAPPGAVVGVRTPQGT